ncbi:MAG: hypothetical protein ABJJ72_12280, partial [Anderseniella sp.]
RERQHLTSSEQSSPEDRPHHDIEFARIHDVRNGWVAGRAYCSTMSRSARPPVCAASPHQLRWCTSCMP